MSQQLDCFFQNNHQFNINRCKNLLLYAEQYNCPGVLQVLLDHGADVNSQDVHGNTALMYAIKKGHNKIAKILLNRSDIDVTMKNKSNENALVWAVIYDNKEIIGLLREKGAVTPLDYEHNSVFADVMLPLLLTVCVFSACAFALFTVGPAMFGVGALAIASNFWGILLDSFVSVLIFSLSAGGGWALLIRRITENLQEKELKKYENPTTMTFSESVSVPSLTDGLDEQVSQSRFPAPVVGAAVRSRPEQNWQNRNNAEIQNEPEVVMGTLIGGRHNYNK